MLEDIQQKDCVGEQQSRLPADAQVSAQLLHPGAGTGILVTLLCRDQAGFPSLLPRGVSREVGKEGRRLRVCGSRPSAPTGLP